MPDLQDRHVLALTTRSDIAVEQYVNGRDQQLLLNAGRVDELAAAVSPVPQFARGHAALAFARWYRQDVPGAKAAAETATGLVPATTPREQRHVEIVHAFVN